MTFTIAFLHAQNQTYNASARRKRWKPANAWQTTNGEYDHNLEVYSDDSLQKSTNAPTFDIEMNSTVRGAGEEPHASTEQHGNNAFFPYAVSR